MQRLFSELKQRHMFRVAAARGWPYLWRPVGADDFVCDWSSATHRTRRSIIGDGRPTFGAIRPRPFWLKP